MNTLLHKKEAFKWNPEAQKVFEKLKQMFLEQPVLQMIDQKKQFKLECNASQFATGAVLLQRYQWR